MLTCPLLSISTVVSFLLNYQVCTETGAVFASIVLAVAVFTSIVLVVQRSIHVPQVHFGLGRCQLESVQGQNKIMHDRAPSSIYKHLLLFC